MSTKGSFLNPKKHTFLAPWILGTLRSGFPKLTEKLKQWKCNLYSWVLHYKVSMLFISRSTQHCADGTIIKKKKKQKRHDHCGAGHEKSLMGIGYIWRYSLLLSPAIGTIEMVKRGRTWCTPPCHWGSRQRLVRRNAHTECINTYIHRRTHTPERRLRPLSRVTRAKFWRTNDCLRGTFFYLTLFYFISCCFILFH